MTLEDLEFYGSLLRVEFDHTPDDPDVGFVGFCVIENIVASIAVYGYG